jgi:hypothetical protein
VPLIVPLPESCSPGGSVDPFASANEYVPAGSASIAGNACEKETLTFPAGMLNAAGLITIVSG